MSVLLDSKTAPSSSEHCQAAALPAGARPDHQIQTDEIYGKLPLSFEANEGQTDETVRFLSRGNGCTLFLTTTEAVFSLVTALRSEAKQPGKNHHRVIPSPTPPSPQTVVRMRLVDSNPTPEITGERELPGKSNYFIGSDPYNWHTDIRNYTQVRYLDIYPGVDLLYHGNQGQLEYDFMVGAGADPGSITMTFEGISQLEIDSLGDLVLRVDGGELRQHRPRVFQEVDGIRKDIAGSYRLKGGNQVGFRINSYDSTRPLVIDPTLVYSTYLGGSGDEAVFGITVDSGGSAYIAGLTTSLDFPSKNPLQPNPGGGNDAFVAKLGSAGSALAYTTYLGGSGDDQCFQIAVDGSGNAYVTGFTTSTNFPASNALQKSAGGDGDAFVAKLNATGSALAYSTYLGGNGADSGFGLAVDGSGNAYVTGYTQSSNFPTQYPLQSSSGGGDDAFVVKLNSAGSALLYSTYLGGSGNDQGFEIAADGSGNAYVTGYTRSTNFPAKGALQPLYSGNDDAFVIKLNSAGSALVYSTYLGGSGVESGNSIAVDGAGNAYVTGSTSSSNFPTKNPLQPNFGGGAEDAFVAQLNSTGSALVYSTYLGGSGYEYTNGITVDSSGNVYVTGNTSSTNFPVESPLQSNFGGSSQDAFVAMLSSGGSTLAFSTCFGGNGSDSGDSVAVDSNRNIYVTGSTNSKDFPLKTPLQAAFGGFYDAYVAKISLGASPPGKATLVSPSGSISTSTPTYTWNAVPSSTWYLLWVSNNGTQKIQTWYTAAQAGCALGTGTCSVTPTTALALGSGQWWIQTWNDAGYGPWSDPMSFTVMGGVPGKASLISPSGTVNTTTPTYAWNAVAFATWYQLWVNDSSTSTGKIKTWYTAAQAGCASGTGTCSVTPTTALASGSAQWWIQTWNDSGSGPWSDAMSFTVGVAGPPGKATLVSPTGTVTTTTPSYTWNAATGSTWYLLWVNDSTNSSGKIKTWYSAEQAGCASGTGTCWVTPTTSLAPGSAQWWVQTWNDSGYGPWSDGMSFTVSVNQVGRRQENLWGCAGYRRTG